MDCHQSCVKYFEEEILVHYDYLYKFIIIATKDDSLAKDIVQETMTKSWEKIHRVSQYTDKKTALRTIARNTLYNHYKKKSHNERLMLHSHIECELHTNFCGMSHFLMCENRRDMLRAIGKLKRSYRQIIVLRYYYEQSFKDVARMLNMNYNTVLSYHRRAIKDLQVLLTKEQKD